ncbi:MAG: hypothetical protein Q7J15_07990 [Candidatus Desulfaltia sp.]|nr:hypothetical protein [Candidatus Desulfaltia sp.]
MRQLTLKEKVNIIKDYTEQLTPMITLAKQHNRSRHGIWKLLNKAGVDTSKRKITVSCSTCGKEIKRTKARIRRQLNHFCDYTCYFAFLEAGNGNPYIQSSQGQRIARVKAAEYIELKDGYIVHHEDRNTLNNMIHNLKVFRNQGDHIRYHRGFAIEPLWDGNKL